MTTVPLPVSCASTVSMVANSVLKKSLLVEMEGVETYNGIMGI